MTVVGFAAPLNFTTAVEAKFEPTTFKLKPGPPATTVPGLKNWMVGTGYVPTVTVKGTVPGVEPPPGCGLLMEIR